MQEQHETEIHLEAIFAGCYVNISFYFGGQLPKASLHYFGGSIDKNKSESITFFRAVIGFSFHLVLIRKVLEPESEYLLVPCIDF